VILFKGVVKHLDALKSKFETRNSKQTFNDLNSNDQNKNFRAALPHQMGTARFYPLVFDIGSFEFGILARPWRVNFEFRPIL
jgi:hypothetical protein